MRELTIRNIMQIRSQGFVAPHGRAVIHKGHDRNTDILFNGFEQSFADHRGAAEQGIDVDKEGYVPIMVKQAEYLEDIVGGFPTVV